ncbi:MAG: hypothetical protein K2K20_07330, partial [Lachnospiraceae bacterium]|nr:hypothetical protein [Lachnospiraceae bacterium]
KITDRDGMSVELPRTYFCGKFKQTFAVKVVKRDKKTIFRKMLISALYFGDRKDRMIKKR